MERFWGREQRKRFLEIYLRSKTIVFEFEGIVSRAYHGTRLREEALYRLCRLFEYYPIPKNCSFDAPVPITQYTIARPNGYNALRSNTDLLPRSLNLLPARTLQAQAIDVGASTRPASISEQQVRRILPEHRLYAGSSNV
jgi:hypothetical protein